MTETIMSVAIIMALLTGGAALIKSLFTKNENKQLEYAHTERMIELLGKQNDNSEKTLEAIEGLRSDVGGLKEELNGLNSRVLALEEKHLKS